MMQRLQREGRYIGKNSSEIGIQTEVENNNRKKEKRNDTKKGVGIQMDKK